MTDADELRAAGGVEYSLDGVTDEEVAALSAAMFDRGVRHAVDPIAIVVHPDDEAAADAALDVVYGPDPAAPDAGAPPVASAAEQRLAVAELRATGGPVYDLADHAPEAVAALVERLTEHRVRHAIGPEGELAVHRNDEHRVDAVLDELFGSDESDPADMTMFDVVETYATFGDHRTGSKADLDTAAWLTDHLDVLGAEVEPRQVVFDRYDVRAALTGARGPIDCVPVFYEALGALVTDDVEIVHAPVGAVGSADGLDAPLAAPPAAPARVLVIDGPPGWPVAPNRPVARPGGVPTVVVAGDAGGLDGAELEFDAQLVPGVAPIVAAELGPADGAPITVTTPLSGWFACAGERGSGLAVALEVARALAGRGRRVRFVAASGHELDHLGVRVWLDEMGHGGGPVVHLGASVAACDPADDGSLRLATSRFVMADPPTVPGLDDAVAPAAFAVVDPDPWPGEGAEWRATGAPVLSFVGRFRWFHTANDVPAVATDDAALDAARTAVLHAVDRFLVAVER